MPRQIIADQWEAFERNSLSKHPVSEAMRVKQARRAFYAGAQAVMFKVTQVCAPNNLEKPGDEAIEELRRVNGELTEFTDLVRRGMD